MTDKLSLIESIVNENAVDFRQIVNKVLLEKLATRLDEEYKGAAKNMFNLVEEEIAEEVEEVEEEETEQTEEQPEEEEESEEAPKAPEGGSDRVKRSYGAY
jgi:hypothetical protein